MQVNYLKQQRSIKLAKTILLIFGILFFIVGLVIIIITIYNYQNATAIDAKIIDIVYSRHYDDDSNRFLISFVYNNQEYVKETSFYSSFYNVGDTIKVYITNGNVNNVWSLKINVFVSVVFLLIGVIILLVYISLLIKKLNKTKLKNYLKENGTLIQAKIVNIKMNTHYSINNIHPFNIICEYEDRFYNDKYTFVSENIWDDPSNIIHERNIEYLNIYIDNKNKKKYYMDVDSLKELMNNNLSYKED